MKYVYLGLLLLLTVLTVSGCSKQNNTPIACTMEAKLCSDGSAVGRNSSNNCQFDACPADKIYIGNSPEKCQVIKFMCVQGRQPFFDDKGCGCEVTNATNTVSNTTVPSGKLQAYDCTDRTQACTKEYMPVCGQVQVECVRAPCPPIKETFSNKCVACANSLTISYTEGACTE